MTAVNEWATVLESEWGTSAPLELLAGEYDLNFGVPVGGGMILKVMRAGCDEAIVAMQVAMLRHLEQASKALPIPAVVPTCNGDSVATCEDAEGRQRLVWMLRMLPGRPLAVTKPKDARILRQLGEAVGAMDKALADFTHPGLERELKWDLRASLWVRSHLDLVGDPNRQATLRAILQRFERVDLPLLHGKPSQAIHNDVNDYNILVESPAAGSCSVSGIIDFGDSVCAPVLCDLAITGAYAILDQPDPVEALAALVEGFTSRHPLAEDEIASLWNLVLTRLAVSVVNSALVTQEKPDDPYVTISEQPAWDVLDGIVDVNEEYAHVRLRRAAGMSGNPRSRRVHEFLEQHKATLYPLFAHSLADYVIADMSVAGRDAPDNPLATDMAHFERLVTDVRTTAEYPLIGRYGEPRLVYTGQAFFSGNHPSCDRRTVHVGLDVFLNAGEEVRAPLNGLVHMVTRESEHQGYGGVVVLSHATDAGDRFFTLYGHLEASVVDRLTPGQPIGGGEPFARLGEPQEIGGWPAHLHLQLGVMEQADHVWPGVVDPDEYDSWRALFPNPAPLLGLEDPALEAGEFDAPAAMAQRACLTASNLELSYRSPVTILRGWKQFLFDDRGRPYLDAYNNVPHVGHSHPRITNVLSRQVRFVNTNTRYLQPVFQDYARALTSRLPESLEVCFVLNCGSEANELAIRLVRNFTEANDIIVSRHGYHGHTGVATDLSEYKFNGKGGKGQADWVHVAEMPDTYRGRFGANDPQAGRHYAADVERILNEAESAGRGVAAFISEPFPSVGGQIVPPDDYLSTVYAHVRSRGGLCIADEVQTGLGRLGHYQWGFEQQGAEPDIVVLGKPIGNGYPLAAVITTRAIADAFANGMEFFSTFGGSSVSCVVGREMLSILDDEALAQNAARTGDYLLQGLERLAERFGPIGDVRGIGLFIGVEIIDSRGGPDRARARYIVNRLRERRILIGSDGPHDNVLKIRPPLCFDQDDSDVLLGALGAIMEEL